MIKTTVESSNIDSVGWENEQLFVYFKNGTAYRYESVPFQVYTDLVEAESAGKFINREVKPVYTFTKL